MAESAQRAQELYLGSIQRNVESNGGAEATVNGIEAPSPEGFMLAHAAVSTTEEPDAGKPHVRVCMGGPGDRHLYHDFTRAVRGQMKKDLKRSFTNVGLARGVDTAADCMKSFLEHHAVARSARPWKMLNLFKEKAAVGWDNLPRTLIYHEVLEVAEIISVLGRSHPDLVLDAITKDHIEESESSNQLGRNSQFELLVGTKYKRAGYNVKFGEPDIYFDHMGRRHNIACKRPQSAKKLLLRVKEAARQIALQDGLGIIALDLTPSMMKTVDPTQTLGTIATTGKQLVWDGFLAAKYRKIEECVATRATIIHCYAGLNQRLGRSYVYCLFDYAIEIPANRTSDDRLFEIINRVQDVHPATKFDYK